MKNLGRLVTASFLLSLFLFLAGCGGSSGTNSDTTSGAPSGVVKLDLTDAPASDYSHAYVTVTGVAFHVDANAGFTGYSSAKAVGWQVVNLPQPKTVDLAQLANGTMFADLNGNSSLFSGMTLPVGKYYQLRIFLASTEDAYLGTVPGLVYNNEVQLNGDATHYPLRVPTADEGIRVVPESPVVVTSGASTSLALDFNLNNDILELPGNETASGTPEFLLKPRLGYFDMGNVGAVTGKVSFGNLSTSRIVVKAEQVKSGTNYRVVRRMTGVDKSSGVFNLYPLPVFGNATTAVYDILVRGRNVQTAIVKGVTVHKATTPANGVNLGSIALQPGTEFTAQLGSGMHPSGAWLNFYQTIAGDPAGFEVRYRHLDPYTGLFVNSMELSTGSIQVATFTPGQPLVFTADTTSQNSFSVVADAAGLYGRGGSHAGVHGAAGQLTRMSMAQSDYPQVNLPAQSGQISGTFDMTLLGTGMGHGMGGGMRNLANPSHGQLYVTHGGMIIDSMGDLGGDTTVAAAMHAGGGSNHAVSMTNLPSGVAGAVYGMYALGWGNGKLEAGSTHGIDLRNGSAATAVVKMK